MKRLLLLLVFVVVIGAYLYDGYKPFSSSWSVRSYFALREGALTRFAHTFAADEEIKSLALHSSDDVSFEVFGENPPDYEAYERRVTEKYAPQLQATTLFGMPVCGLWFKNEGRILCSGIPPVGHVLVRPDRDPDPFFGLMFWPDGVDVNDQCSSEMVSDQFGSCDVVLSENWTIHYEWFPGR
ncbi:MAG: hypothetical protein AAFR21_15260 [Pseudomonadota bacterium]